MSQINREALHELVASVEAWREKFPSEMGDATQLAILIEEVGELARAILRGDRESASNEWADVLFVVLKLPLICNLDQSAMKTVAEKNNAKTTLTHYTNSEGKVVKRRYAQVRSTT